MNEVSTEHSLGAAALYSRTAAVHSRSTPLIFDSEASRRVHHSEIMKYLLDDYK